MRHSSSLPPVMSLIPFLAAVVLLTVMTFLIPTKPNSYPFSSTVLANTPAPGGPGTGPRPGPASMEMPDHGSSAVPISTTPVDTNGDGKPDRILWTVVATPGSGPITDLHFRTNQAGAKINASAMAGGLPIGWGFNKTKTSINFYMGGGQTAQPINPGFQFTFGADMTSPSATVSLASRWYATAVPQRTPPYRWTPRRSARTGGATPSPAPTGGATPGGGSSTGGTTRPHPPYEGGVIDFGPKEPGDPTTGTPVTTADLAGCNSEGVCTIGLGDDETIGLSAEAHPSCSFAVIVAESGALGELLNSGPIPPTDLPGLAVWYDTFELGEDGVAEFKLMTTASSQPGDVFDFAVIVDDDCNGIFDATIDLSTAIRSIVVTN